jgi:hypothetical protein
MSDRAITRRRFIPPDSGSTLSSDRSVSWTNEQLLRPAARLGPRQVEVAAVDDQVLQDAQFLVERVRLRDHAEARPDRRSVAGRIQPEDGQLTGSHGRDGADHPHRRGLARAVRPEESECLARGDVEFDAVDGRE